MWDCGMTPTAGCRRVFSSPWCSIYSVDRASDLVWENLLLVLQREKIHHHHYWSLSVHTSVSMQAIVTPAKYYLANCKIYARLNTRQCLQVVFWSSSPIILLSRAVLGFSNNNCTVLLLRSITSFTLFSRAVHVALASFAPSPSFPLDVFWYVSAHFYPLRFSVWGCLVGASQMVVMVTVLARLWLPSGLQGTFPMGLI